MPTKQEDVVTGYIKAYLAGRDKWLKTVLIIYGIILVVILGWFTVITYYFMEWNTYRQRAKVVIQNSEKALEQWRAATGINDTTGVNNGTRKKE